MDMDPGSSSHVTHENSEALIRSVERRALELHAGDRNIGLFGPDSMSWQINREAAVFLGAGRAALLQLAHPWVATALEQHSGLMAHPIGRFHNTFRIVYAMIFGSLDQGLAAARHLYRLHTRIQGELPEGAGAWPAGAHYEANEVAALRWVFATLVESAVLAYELVLPPLSPGQLAAYYADSVKLAGLFGLTAADLPRDWPAFLAYCRSMEMSASLAVTAGARTMAQSLLRGAGSWTKPPAWYRALTTEWIAPRLRAQFELDSSTRHALAAERARARLPRVYRSLPTTVRFVGPWHEAQARLSRQKPSPVVAWSNRFWIGAPWLPFAEPS